MKYFILFIFFVTSLGLNTLTWAKSSKKSIGGQLNLNTATKEQFDQLPGISPKKAQAIVDYRKEHPFKKVEDLDEVKGFSSKSIEKLKSYVSIEGSNSLAVEKNEKSKKKHKTKKEKTERVSKKG